MKQSLLLVLFLLIGYQLLAQNLVGNPGFETFTSLPNGYSQYNRATGWTNCAGSGTPEYYHTSGSTPTAFGPMVPNSGAGQMGFLTRHSSTGVAMEYLCRNLSSPMVVGQNYEVSFYLTRGTGAGLYPSAAGNIGAYFSTPLPTQAGAAHINVIPQVEQVAIINVTNAWQQVTFNFTPTAPFSSISIGNFHNFASTPFSGGDGRAYYYIDDIMVQPAVILSIDKLTFEADKYQSTQSFISWHFEDADEVVSLTIQRSVDGIEFETVAANQDAGAEKWIDATPFQGNNYYRLRVLYVDGTIAYSDVRVLVFDAEPAVTISRVSPNPFREWLVIDLQNTADAVDVEIALFDILGRQVHSETQQMLQGRMKLELSIPSDLAAGSYWLSITSNTGGRKLHKVVKQ